MHIHDHEDTLVAKKLVRDLEKQFPGREAQARECLAVLATVRLKIEYAVLHGYQKVYPNGCRTKDQLIEEIESLTKWAEENL